MSHKAKDNMKLVDGKMLRRGYTTGSCATAAAKAALYMHLTKETLNKVEITTPSSTVLSLDLHDIDIQKEYAICAVQKDSGDDPDITNGCFLYVKVSTVADDTDIDIVIKGGVGVGIVTKEGLNQPVGEYAINSGPRNQIKNECIQVCNDLGFRGRVYIEISIPNGLELAKRTFNPLMGIEGGLSILGTTGIVEPMSNQAIVHTTSIELKQLQAQSIENVLLTVGNYGEKFITQQGKYRSYPVIKVSNFISDALSDCVELGFRHVVLVSHIGKLVKLGIGITNTHSSNGDGRIECLMSCALRAGASLELLKSIDDCVSTDAVIALLKDADLLHPTMDVLKQRIHITLSRFVSKHLDMSVICYAGSHEDMYELFKIDEV